MEPRTVARDNALFFLTAVGLGLSERGCSHVALVCLLDDEEGHYPTDNVGHPGYIRFDLSVIRQAGEDFKQRLIESIQGDILQKISFGLSSRTEFEGDLCERWTVSRDGYVFSFRIVEYERDQDHSFVRVGPEGLPDISEEETLGRVVVLTIKPVE